MSLHPEVQRKAQAELDAVVGLARLPTLADRELLPYVNAVCKEVLRWHTSGPLGMAHVNTSDDEFNGYLIPRNSTVMVNVWYVQWRSNFTTCPVSDLLVRRAITQDPETYPNPEKFAPERFLRDGKPTSDVLDPTTYSFGFGRRQVHVVLIAVSRIQRRLNRSDPGFVQGGISPMPPCSYILRPYSRL